jgi:ribonuclease HI
MIIYTDGSCLGNGKAVNSGGFGVVVLDNKENLLYTYSKRSENTTNNREELKAILYTMLNHGVKTEVYEFSQVEIPIVYSDSSYCVNTFNDWMFRWASNGWIKSDKKEPENLDLIKAYYDWYQKGYRIELRKVKGHSNNKWNDLADKLATGQVAPNNNNLIMKKEDQTWKI